jgi:molecular chaperone DnaJ
MRPGPGFLTAPGLRNRVRQPYSAPVPRKHALQPDLYDLLDVDRSSTPEALKKAYRKKALAFHPDRNPDDPEAAQRFKEVTYAYGILSDPIKKAQYDRFGRVLSDGRSAGPFGVNEEVDLGEVVGQVFKDLFGGRRKKKPGHRKRDLRYTVTITLEEAAQGTEKEVRFQRKTPEGRQIDERLKVKVPPGVDTGQKLKVAGKGTAGNKGEGDLYVVVNVSDHVFFRRRGGDVFCDVPVSYSRAVLGGDLLVPTLRGPVTVKLPGGTQPGAVLTLKGKGIRPIKGKGAGRPGDQFVKVVLEMPTTLDDSVREQLAELDEALRAAGSPLRKAYEELLAQTKADA